MTGAGGPGAAGGSREPEAHAEGAETEAYRRAGVDYGTLDAAKRAAQQSALATSALAAARGARVDDSSRGEPATLLEVGGIMLAVVLECLGTKSAIARAVEELTGDGHWDAVAYDTVAAAVNDCCCVGALPLSVNAYFATGASSWYGGGRLEALVAGWRRACEDAGAAWVGGESPTLAGVVGGDQIDLAASVLGLVPPGCQPWRGELIEPGDEIVLVASSGLHANGASLARTLAGELADGYATKLASGRSFGEALLDPSVCYVPLAARLRAGGPDVHYASHITGHGLRKLMRADRQLTYRIEVLPPVPEVLGFLVEGCRLAPRDAYGTFNMGAGLALYCAAGTGEEVVRTAGELGLAALRAGAVEEGRRRVVLEPVGVEYSTGALDLR